MRRIENFGTNPNSGEGFVRADATNFRLSDILAAVGVAQLQKRDEIISRRRELATRYDELLADVEGVVPPAEPAAADHTYQSYCVFVAAGDDETRDELIEALAEANIETQIETYALHNTEAFADTKRVGPLNVSASLESNLLTLPMAHSMTDADQQRVVRELNQALELHR